MATGDPSLSTTTIGQIARRVTTPAELVGADFETEVTNPDGSKSSAKVGTGVLIQTVGQNLPGPNNRKDLRKAVRFYDTTHPLYTPGQSTLVGLNTDYLCRNTTCNVVFGPAGTDQVYEVLYDPTGPLQVYEDAHFIGPKGPARWYRVGSNQAGTAGIAAFSNLTTVYQANSQVVSQERLWQTDTQLVRSSYQDNLIPAPADTPGNPWHEISRTASTALYQYVGVPLARQLQLEEEFQPGRLYIVRSATGNVYVHALTGAGLATLAHQAGPDGSFVIGTYDLESDSFAAGGLGGGDSSPFTLTPTETIGGIQAGQSFTGTAQQYWQKALVKYQAPAFSSFTLQDTGSQTVEVGTQFPAGFKSFKWSTTNGGNVTPSTITITDETAGSTLIANTANDGVQSISTAAFTVVKGLSRRYRISAQNTNGQSFSAVLDINGLLKSYFGYSTKTVLSIDDILLLGNGVLQNGRARTVGGVTASGGAYTYYVYEASEGDLSNVIMDGAAPVFGAFTRLADVTGPNALNATVTYRVYRSNSTNAFTNNSLAFS